MIRIISLDILRMTIRPYFGLWLIGVCVALTYIASYSVMFPTKIVALVMESEYQNDRKESEISHGKYRSSASDILNQFANLDVKTMSWSSRSIASKMMENGASLAVSREGSWKIYVLPMSGYERMRVMSYARQIAVSLIAMKPWPVSVFERIRDSEESRVWLERDGVTDVNQIMDMRIIDLGEKRVEARGSLVSGLISLVAIFLPFLVCCGSMAREIENKTIECLVVAPGIRLETVAGGKIVSGLAIVTVVVLCMTSVGLASLDVTGGEGVLSVLGLHLIGMCFSAFIGIGVACMTRSQFGAYLASSLYLLCLIFLSGVLFPIEGSSAFVQILSKLFPLTITLPWFTGWLIHGVVEGELAYDITWLAGQSFIGFLVMMSSLSIMKRSL